MALSDRYHQVLVRLMEFINELCYPKEYQFSQEELILITPVNICCYFCKGAYGVEEPGPADLPLLVCASTLEFWKKSISFFMLNRSMQWNIVSKQGNLTKSTGTYLVCFR